MKLHRTAAVGTALLLAGTIFSGIAPGATPFALSAGAVELAAPQIPFAANEGQLSDGAVRFYARTFGGAVLVKEDGAIVYRLLKTEQASGTEGFSGRGPIAEATLAETIVEAWSDGVHGRSPSGTAFNSFAGNNPERWRAGIAIYLGVSLGEVHMARSS